MEQVEERLERLAGERPATLPSQNTDEIKRHARRTTIVGGGLGLEVKLGNGRLTLVYPALCPKDQRWLQPNDMHGAVVALCERMSDAVRTAATPALAVKAQKAYYAACEALARGETVEGVRYVADPNR